MKIFYKYIFCLLVYVISFASTNPFAPFDKNTFTSIYGEVSLPDSVKLTFGDGSGEVREKININTNANTNRSWFSSLWLFSNSIDDKYLTLPMSIHQWEHASFDEVLQEVVPSVLFMNDPMRAVGEDYSKEYNDVKNQISAAMMKIANGESEGGHIAVVRVILDDGGVIPLPCFFLSGDSDSAAYNVLGIKGLDADGKYFTTISSQGMSATTAQAFSHSERAIGIYLHNNLKTLIDQAKVDKEVSKKPIIIQIKNSAPMCDKCKLFWSHKAYYKDNMLCGKDTSGAAIYDVWADFSISSILFCSNVAGQVDIEQEDLIKFVYKNRQNVTNTAPLSQGKKPQGIKRKHSKITPLATS